MCECHQRGGEGGIGLAACLRKMSASSCFLNEPGWGREEGRALFTSTPAAGQEGEEPNAWFQSDYTHYDKHWTVTMG